MPTLPLTGEDTGGRRRRAPIVRSCSLIQCGLSAEPSRRRRGITDDRQATASGSVSKPI